jgi:hypothetical protein
LLLDFASWLVELYNAEFSMDKLLSALDSCQNTSPGPDTLHNLMLSPLPPTGMECLLSVYTHIWSGNSYPSAWREATVIPILKPYRGHSFTASYRPIRLNGCVCKTMEWTVNYWLTWILESRNLLLNTHCGLQCHRSTLDNLMNLEYHIQNSFVMCQYLVTIFFDLKKAYDRSWQSDILRTYHRWNLRGWLPLFFLSFLYDHHFVFNKKMECHKDQL